MTTTTPQRIGGWLLGPLAWLLVALLSTTLALLLYTAALSSPQTFQTLGGQALTTQILWGVSFITAIAMWYYTLWLTIAGSKSIRFFTRGRWHSRSPVAVYFVGNRIDRPLFQTLVAGKSDVCESVITLQLTCCRLLWING